MSKTRKRSSAEGIQPGGVRQPHVLAIDPSTTCVGVAVIESRDAQLVEWYRIEVPKARVPIARVRALNAELFRVCDPWIETGCLVSFEMPGGAAGRQGSRGLVTMGIGVGYMLSTLDRLIEGRPSFLEPVEVGVWSRLGGGKCIAKETRAALVRKHVSADDYDPGEDPGLDVADAIGLGMWRCGFDFLD